MWTLKVFDIAQLQLWDSILCEPSSLFLAHAILKFKAAAALRAEQTVIFPATRTLLKASNA